MCTAVGFVPIEDMPPFLQLEWRPGLKGAQHRS
jgi:hypothetical protein